MLLSIIMSLIVGVAAGWLANTIMKKNSDDMLSNLGIGMIGAIIGNLLAGLIGLGSTNLVGSLILAVAGACLAIYVKDRFF